MSPRPLRVQATGAIYHAYSHATGDEFLYRDRSDRRRFTSILRATVKKYGLELHFFTILGTHHHLLLTTRHPNIAASMQYLNGVYCQSYNRRHGRKGHVVAGRYGTRLLASEQHGAWLVPYLALNPVRAGLVDRPEEWPWSSYPALIGGTPEWDFVNPRWMLEQFDSDRERARIALRRYVESVLVQELAAT